LGPLQIGHIRGILFFPNKKLDLLVANSLILLNFSKKSKSKDFKKKSIKNFYIPIYMVQVGSKKNTRMFPNKVIVFFLLPNLVGT
jgi:hypothetical protein